jgi:FAD/FMN-containing dehydrogenase
MARTTTDAERIAQFQARLHGDLLRPEDDGYDDARAVWNGMIDKYPALVARCSGIADVITAVNFARETGVPVAVRGGGHNVAGTAVCDDGLVIDLTEMTGVWVDPDAQRAWVQAGATWADVDHETQAFGLATTGGLISHTGVAGLTLGGGIGYLARKHGLALDNLVGTDVVTADGELVHASESQNPDLFWGLRGGGGNFGVVTAFEFRLHELGPEVLAGFLIHPFEAAADGLRFYREFTAEAPDELTCYALFGNIPPEPPFPEAQQGRTGLYFAVCYAGPIADGEEALRPLREFGDPMLDAVQPMPYTALQRSFDEAQQPGNRWYLKSLFCDEISTASIETLVERVDPLSGPLTFAWFEPMGGAIGRVDAGATAYPHRDAGYSFSVAPGWMDPARDVEHIAWARELFAAMRPYGGGVYVHYLDRDEDERIRSAYGDNFDRLVALKNEWDPENLFRMNQNIEPTA